MGRSLLRVGLLAAAAAAVGACQVLSGVSGLIVDLDDDGGADAATDAIAGDGGGADAIDPDAGTATITFEVERPEVGFTVETGEIDRITAGAIDACVGSTCLVTSTVRVPLGATTVTIAAKAGSEAYFTPPCAGSADDLTRCPLTVTGDTTLRLAVVAHNYVFVTSQTFKADLGGVAAADQKCADAAAKAGLPGTDYVAWLSDSVENARTRLFGPAGGASRGFIRRDGRPFADDDDGMLTAGAVYYPIALDENGAAVPKDDVVFTGANGAGNAGGAIYRCQDWTSSVAGLYADVGWAHAGTGEWTHKPTLGFCDQPAHLYCFRRGRRAPLTVRPAPSTSRLAFLSNPVTITSAGIAGLDARCQSDASNAALPGSFKAWVATTTSAASARFNVSPNSGGWYRRDGVRVFSAPERLGQKVAPDGPIAQRADTSYPRDFPSLETGVWTGMNEESNKPSTGLGFSCDDWTNAAVNGTAGDAAFADLRATNLFTTHPCASARAVYCLEE